jgi:hypothetical protein
MPSNPESDWHALGAGIGGRFVVAVRLASSIFGGSRRAPAQFRVVILEIMLTGFWRRWPGTRRLSPVFRAMAALSIAWCDGTRYWGMGVQYSCPTSFGDWLHSKPFCGWMSMSRPSSNRPTPLSRRARSPGPPQRPRRRRPRRRRAHPAPGAAALRRAGCRAPGPAGATAATACATRSPRPTMRPRDPIGTRFEALVEVYARGPGQLGSAPLVAAGARAKGTARRARRLRAARSSPRRRTPC